MTILTFLGRRRQRRQASGAQHSTKRYGQAPLAHVDQVVRETESRVVRPDVGYVQAEPRLRKRVEDAPEVGSLLTKALFWLSMFSKTTRRPRRSNDCSPPVGVRVGDGVELPCQGHELLRNSRHGGVIGGDRRMDRDTLKVEPILPDRRQLDETPTLRNGTCNAASQSSRSSMKAPVAIPKFAAESTAARI